MSGMQPAPEVSVVIAARDAAAWIGDQLDALARQTFAGRLEVVVADNGSSDGTPAVVRRRPAVALVDADAGRGPAYARNAGVRHARAPLLLFCDADDVVDAGWVQAMVGALGDYDAVGGFLDHAALNDERPRRWRPSEATAGGLPVGYAFLPFAPSSNMGIRRAAFDQLGGFDEALARAEDVDLCWRLQGAGMKLGYEPAARVAYRHRTRVLGTLKQAYEFGRAGATLCAKHGRRRPLGVRFVELARAAPRHLLTPGRQVDWLRKLSHDVGMLVGRLS